MVRAIPVGPDPTGACAGRCRGIHLRHWQRRCRREADRRPAESRKMTGSQTKNDRSMPMSDTPSTLPKPKKSVALSGTAAGNTALCTVGRSGNDTHYRGYHITALAHRYTLARKSVGWGQGVYVRVNLGGRRIIT